MLLGVILSVSTLILVVALINGTNAYIADRVANLGNGVFLISRYGIINSQEAFVKAARRNKQLSYDDYVALRDGLKLPKNVGLECRFTDTVRREGQSAEDVAVRGVTANIGEMDTEEVIRGRYISDNDNDHRSFTAMIGADVVKKLFPSIDPLGKTITIKGYDFEVVGIAKPIGNVMGQPQDNFVYIPIQTWYKLNGPHTDSFAINVQTRAPEFLEQTKDEARALMRARRHVAPNEDDNFGLFGSDNLMNLWKNLTGTLAGAMVGFVSIFLVIGGVVIMNVMLASVTERTREILGHPEPVPCRGVGNERDGRRDWHCRSLDSGGHPQQNHAAADGGSAFGGDCCDLRIDGGGIVLWRIPCAQGGTAEPDRSLAGRFLKEQMDEFET
jgi:putative ABC transport system permease protein